MAHHKRGRPKHQRNGCLYCKPHKDNHAKDKEMASVKRRLQDDLDDLQDDAKLEGLDHDCGPECGLWEPKLIDLAGKPLTAEMIEDMARRMIEAQGTLSKEEEEQVKRLTRK